VHFERPLGVHAGAFAHLCPAITVECGKAGSGTGTAHAIELIEACLAIAQLPSHDLAPNDVDLFRTYAIVKAPIHLVSASVVQDSTIQIKFLPLRSPSLWPQRDIFDVLNTCRVGLV
jgi:hypothetical protein